MMKAKILYVEDYPVVQQMYLDVLKAAGFDVDTANDGKQALEMSAENSYDIVLLDLLLPHVTGVEFLREFRKKHPKTEVIVLSDFDNPHMVKDVKDLGVEHYWIKVENTPHVLVKKLEEVMNDKKDSAS